MGARKKHCGCQCNIAFIGRDDYRKHLEKHHLLIGKDERGRAEDTEVAHIIANANGGPDHVDNYLFVYGGRFNRSTKENFDHIQCYLAGKDRAIRAVEVALRVAEDETLQTKEKKYIEWRGNKRPTIFTESELYRKHNFSGERGTLEMRARRIGQKLYAKGEEEWDAFLKVCGRSGVCYRRNFAKSAVEAYGKLELLVDRLMINVKQEYVDAVRSAEPGKLKLPNVNLFGLQVDVKELELWVRKAGKRIDPNERIIGEEQTGAGVASESVGIEREVEEQPRVAKPKSNVVPLGRRFRTQDLFSTEKKQPFKE